MKKTTTIAVIAAFTIMTLSGCQSEKKDVDINISAKLSQGLGTYNDEPIPVLLDATAPNNEVFGDCANTRIKMIGTATPNYNKSSFEINITSITCPYVNDIQVKLPNITYDTMVFAVDAKPIEEKADIIFEKEAQMLKKRNPDKNFLPILIRLKDSSVIVNIKSIQR